MASPYVARVRAAIAGKMVNTVDIVAVTEAEAEAGSTEASESILAIGVPCNIQPSGDERTVAVGRETMIVTNRVYFLDRHGLEQGMLLRQPGEVDLYVAAVVDATAGHKATWAADCVQQS